MRTANYLPVTAAGGTDQPRWRSVQVGSGGGLHCCSLAGEGLEVKG